jgi:radical SAM-linked protein
MAGRPKSAQGELTGDCRGASCHHCGVCDFEKVAPVLLDHCLPAPSPCTIKKNHFTQEEGRQFVITFSKTGTSRFLGHLEMAKVFVRALRRADIRLIYSEGFHPQPKLSFQDALPVGMESLQETLLVTVAGETTPKGIIRRLNAELPAGLVIAGCHSKASKFGRPESVLTTYRLVMDEDVFNPEKIADFMTKTAMLVLRTNRKGKIRQIDLRQAVSGIERISASELISCAAIVTR